jgi:hypothetical protein
LKALGLSLSEFFSEGREVLKPAKTENVPFYEERILGLLKKLNERDKRLLISIANTMVKQGSKHGGPK